MSAHGYVRGLKETAEKLEVTVRDYRLLDYCGNPLNPSGLVLIEKSDGILTESAEVKWRCPLTHSMLLNNSTGFFSPETGILYPVLSGIPLLRSSHSVVASAFKEFSNTTPLTA